ncbi:MAG: VWA domain-containing protein, partial [Micromonosporaceae bacterium]|nr:VWA domain-containing protein [Micromonosporaceae bacterium]
MVVNLLARSALVAGTVLGLLGLYSAPALAEGEADLVVSNVTTEPGKLDFILTGPGLPDHTAIAPGGITVTADGKNLETEFKSAKTLDRTELPARGVVIVLDTSETMAGAPLAAAEVALFDYVNALSEDVAIGLVASSGATKSVVNLTYDRAAVRTAAGALAAGGSNSLNDAILLATQQFSSMVTERRIVVLAGGPEKDSAATLGEVTAAITAQQTPVDLLVYGSAKVADLETLATGSGGAIAKAETREALDPAVAVLTSKMSAPILVSAVVPVALSGRVIVVDIGVTSPAATVTTSASVSFAFDPKALPPLETARLKT